MLSSSLSPPARSDIRIAAAYIRVSTDDQVEYSPDAQLLEIRKYAAAHGFIIPEQFIFLDEGISGKRTKKRDAFNTMIGVAKTKPKPFDAILLWKFSRFARNREDSVVYKSMLRKQLGIDVISISEPVGDDKMSIIIEAMIEAMDEYYSINLAEEVRRGMSEKARRGGLQSNPSFGYAVENNLLVPREPEASQVQEMFRRFLAGDGFVHIAKWANSVGIRTHRGNKFENRTVEYILRNPVYIGKLRWNPTGRSRRDFDNENIILADAGHQPLVSQEDFDAVQDLIHAQKVRLKYHARPSFDRKDWLSGIVRCSACGGTLIFARPHYFKCNNYVRGSCKTPQHIRVDILHEILLARLREDAQTTSNLSFHVIHRSDASATELSSLEQSLSATQRKMQRLRDSFLAGADTVEEYSSMKAILTQEVETIQARISALRSQDHSVDTSQLLRESISSCITILESPDVTIDKKYDALNSIVESCAFNKTENLLKLTYRIIL